AKFTVVVDVLEPPAGATAIVDLVATRTQVMDAVVEVDEKLMEKYLMEEPLTHEEIAAAIPKALVAGTLVSIFCTAGKKDIGVVELLNALADDALSPVEGAARTATPEKGGDAVPLTPAEAGEFVGQVFKTINDKFVGNLSYLRLFKGRVTTE